MALHGKFVLNDADFSPLTIYGVGTFMAFSGGGKYRNRGGCAAIPDTGPIAPGKYWIVTRSKGGLFSQFQTSLRDAYNQTVNGATFKHDEWFALHRDDMYIDDWTWIYGVKRGNFRLHPGKVSKGCITLQHDSDFAVIRNALLRTTQIRIPCTKSLTAYGYIEVVTNETSC